MLIFFVVEHPMNMCRLKWNDNRECARSLEDTRKYIGIHLAIGSEVRQQVGLNLSVDMEYNMWNDDLFEPRDWNITIGHPRGQLIISLVDENLPMLVK